MYFVDLTTERRRVLHWAAEVKDTMLAQAIMFDNDFDILRYLQLVDLQAVTVKREEKKTLLRFAWFIYLLL